MKKRFLIPLVLFSAYISMIPARMEAKKQACADGNQKACQFFAGLAGSKAEREAKQKADRAEWDAQRAREKGADLSVDDVVRCEFLLKRQLNDPDSYRKLNNITEVMRSGVIRYTATNGFGGRVQAIHHCG